MKSNTQRPGTFPSFNSTKPNSTNPFQPFTTAPITPPSTPPHPHSDSYSTKSQNYFNTFPQPPTSSIPTTSTPNPSPKPATMPPNAKTNNKQDFSNTMYNNMYQDTGHVALGMLYCPQCNRGFGNKLVFQRHFMFAPAHRDVDRSSLEFYHRLWRHSWKGEDGGSEGDGGEQNEFEEVDQLGEMGLEPDVMEDVRATPEPDFETGAPV